MKFLKQALCLVGLLVLTATINTFAQSTDDQNSVEEPGAIAAKQLASRDPLVRQHAAEELARLEATDQRRLVEGYRLEEKNARVKLALEWALYRMGKSESLFPIVRALDSSRSEQATSYLNTLEKPDSLYFFLERMNGNTQVKLLEILAKIGDAGTLDKIKTYSASFDPKISDAAKQAASEIEGRLGQPPRDKSSRPRKVDDGETTP
jgi:HEAT repeat protein